MRKTVLTLTLCGLAVFAFSGCDNKKEVNVNVKKDVKIEFQAKDIKKHTHAWYKKQSTETFLKMKKICNTAEYLTEAQKEECQVININLTSRGIY